ncbi:hypothetical protein HTZ85_09730 [Escherichia coli]|nr:hypothetical protein [Escherichia coli]
MSLPVALLFSLFRSCS